MPLKYYMHKSVLVYIFCTTVYKVRLTVRGTPYHFRAYTREDCAPPKLHQMPQRNTMDKEWDRSSNITSTIPVKYSVSETTSSSWRYPGGTGMCLEKCEPCPLHLPSAPWVSTLEGTRPAVFPRLQGGAYISVTCSGHQLSMLPEFGTSTWISSMKLIINY